MSRRAGVVLALLGLFLVGLGGGRASEEDLGSKAPLDPQGLGKGEKGVEKKKPKIPPFKYSAWCTFKEFNSFAGSQIRQGLREEPVPEKNDHTRWNAQFWRGIGRPGYWLALNVELGNTTEKDLFRGRMRIRLDPIAENQDSNPNPYVTWYVQDFEVPPKTTKLFTFSLLCPDQPNSDIRIQIQGNMGFFERTVFLTPAFHEELIAVVSEEAGAFRDFDTSALRGKESQGAHPRLVAVISAGELPSRWHDLAMASLIIIDGPPREGFSSAQVEALETYAQAGGRILLSTGRDPARLKKSEGQARGLVDLAGILIKGAARAEKLETAPAISLKGEIPVLDAIPSGPHTRPRVINPQTGLIETMERELGLGAVTYLAFSLNEKLLEGWRGRTRIPLEQLQANRKRILFTPEEVMGSSSRNRGFFSGLMVGEEPESPEMAKSLPKLRQALDESFAQDTPVQPASSGKVAGFLLFFLLITVPGNYLLFGWLRRREWAWLAIPFWAIFFSFLAYFMGYYGQLGKLTVNEVGVIEAGPGQSFATGRTFLCLYAPRRDEYDLSFEPEHQAGPGHLIFPDLKTRGLDNFGPLNLRDRQKSLDIEDLLVQSRSTRRLELIHRAGLKDGVELAIRRDKAKGVFSGQVWNRTGQDLLKAVWVHQASGGMKTFALDLPAKMGAPKEFQAPLDLSEGWGSLKETFFSAPPRFPSAPGAEAKERAAKLLTYLESRIPKFGQNLLLCWLDGSQLPIKVNGEPPLHSRGFSLMIMPFNIEEGQGLIKMEEGWRIFHSAEADLINEANPLGEEVSWTEKKGREPFFTVGRNPTQAALLWRLMAPLSPHRLNQPVLRLNLNIHALTLQEAKEKISAQIRNAPSAFSAKAVLEILEQGVAKAVWRRMESLDLVLKAGQTCPPWSLSFPVESSMVLPESSFVLRLRLEGARFEGRWNTDGEENRWPVAVNLGGPGPGLILEGKVPETGQGK